MSDRGHHNELGEFLKARRADVTPDKVGLPANERRRRVTGLRREEVAQLASISTDYYTRIEQGRLAGASASSLAAIARALCMSPDETRYLHQLAHKSDALRRERVQQYVHPQTQLLLDSVTDGPALVLGRYMSVLAWNSLAAALYTDFGEIAPRDRNLLRLTFLDPHIRHLYADWESAARNCVAFARMDTARSPADAELDSLVGELSRLDHDFRHWWSAHDVAYKTFGSKRFRHPVAGDLTLDWQILTCAHDTDQSVMVMTAPPGSNSYQALSLLLA